MESQYSGTLLKIASVLMIVFAAISAVLVTINGMSVLGQLETMDAGTVQALEEFTMSESDGLFGAEETFLLISAVAYATVIISAIGNGLRILAGVLGLLRANKPERYKFFNIWGILLLILGVLSLPFTSLATLPGTFNLISGVVAPVLFLIGGSQAKRFIREQPAQ